MEPLQWRQVTLWGKHDSRGRWNRFEIYGDTLYGCWWKVIRLEGVWVIEAWAYDAQTPDWTSDGDPMLGGKPLLECLAAAAVMMREMTPLWQLDRSGNPHLRKQGEFREQEERLQKRWRFWMDSAPDWAKEAQEAE